MFELVRVGEKSYYVNSPAKIGVYAPGGGEVYFIDSGNDKDAGRKLRQILEREGWTLRGILVTHANADHTGGCKYLRAQTGCTVFAPGVDCAITQHPILEPALLYGGLPPKELRGKFLMAPECECVGITDPSFPAEIEVIPLPGHFFDMVGYRLPDGTFFAADCVSSAATLEKYQVGYIYDPAAYLETLARVEALEAEIFIPAHTEPCKSMTELAKLNREKVLEIAGAILDICAQGIAFDDMLAELFRRFSLTMDFSQYALVGSTLRSYLTWLRTEGKITADFIDNRLIWKRA